MLGGGGSYTLSCSGQGVGNPHLGVGYTPAPLRGIGVLPYLIAGGNKLACSSYESIIH